MTTPGHPEAAPGDQQGSCPDDDGSFRATFRIRFDEAGPDGLVRASTLMRLAQDLAWQHGSAAGLERSWYEARGQAWLVRAVDLLVRDPIPAGSLLDARTVVVGHRRSWARRRVELWLAPGEVAGAVAPGRARSGETATVETATAETATVETATAETATVEKATAETATNVAIPGGPAAVATTDWVLVDLEGRLVRIPDSFTALFRAPAAEIELTRVRPGPVPAAAHLVATRVRPHEVDPNGHLNNAVHLDWLDEAVAAAGGEPDVGAIPRHYRVEYVAPLLPGAAATIAAWRAGPTWLVEVQTPGGGPAMRAQLEAGPSPNRGPGPARSAAAAV